MTGTESVFVRTSGCNLRCRFCDTPFASWRPVGEPLENERIVQQLAAWSCRHVVLTGGEPMLFRGLEPLTAALRQKGYHVTIETAGTRYQKVACDLMSISPKLSNSTPDEPPGSRWRARHERRREAADLIRRLIAEHPYQVKFVVGSRSDCDEVQEYLERFPEIRRERVMLMPLGTDTGQLQRVGRWLEPYCRAQRMRFCPRRQIEWYGLRRGT